MAETAKSDVSIGETLAQQIEMLKEKACKLQQVDGFFVSKSTLSTLEKNLDALMAGEIPTKTDPSVLISLNTELESLRARAKRAEDRLTMTQSELAKQGQELQSAKQKLALLDADSSKKLKEIEAKKEPLRIEVKKLRNEIDQLRKNPKSSLEKQEEVSKQLKSTQAELEALNSQRKMDLADLRFAKDQVAALEAQLALEATKYADLRRAQDSQKKEEIETFGHTMRALDPMPDVDSALLKKTLPHDAIPLLAAAAEERRKSIRQYAYNLMLLSSKTDPRNFVGMKDYVKVIFSHVKETTAKKRKKYLPLLDDLRAAMTEEGAKHLKTIRAEYASLINEPSEAEVESAEEEKKEGKQGWWKAFKLDFWKAKASTLSGLRSFWGKTPRPLKACFAAPAAIVCLPFVILKEWHRQLRKKWQSRKTQS